MIIDKIIKIALLPVIVMQSVLPQHAAELISPSCLFSMLFDVECFGCGMGRALQALLHLDWQRAMSFNKLSPAVLLVLVVLFFGGLRDLLDKSKFTGLANYKSDNAH